MAHHLFVDLFVFVALIGVLSCFVRCRFCLCWRSVACIARLFCGSCKFLSWSNAVSPECLVYCIFHDTCEWLNFCYSKQAMCTMLGSGIVLLSKLFYCFECECDILWVVDVYLITNTYLWFQDNMVPRILAASVLYAAVCNFRLIRSSSGSTTKSRGAWQLYWQKSIKRRVSRCSVRLGTVRIRKWLDIRISIPLVLCT